MLTVTAGDTCEIWLVDPKLCGGLPDFSGCTVSLDFACTYPGGRAPITYSTVGATIILGNIIDNVFIPGGSPQLAAQCVIDSTVFGAGDSKWACQWHVVSTIGRKITPEHAKDTLSVSAQI